MGAIQTLVHFALVLSVFLQIQIQEVPDQSDLPDQHCSPLVFPVSHLAKYPRHFNEVDNNDDDDNPNFISAVIITA